MKRAIFAIAITGLTGCTMPDMPEPPEGAKAFAENCAACHGADATGAGPETLGIGKVPPNLTQISARNDGVFPRANVLSIIDGYRAGTHPGRVMPEFGADLSGDLVPVVIDGVETPTPRKLAALLSYLESIQE